MERNDDGMNEKESTLSPEAEEEFSNGKGEDEEV